jgi:cell division transport system ATP-binding protein
MIKFSTVTKSYPTGQVALEDVSFVIEPGEFVFLTGESGAGKTTVMRLLTRETVPTQGEIEFMGASLGKLKSSEIPKHRREVAVVFQDYKLLPDRTIAENIALPLEIAGKKLSEIGSRVTDLLKLVGLEGREAYFPVQLSGGEAQRVGIARALALGPRVIFADEPTGNLDHDHAMSVAKLLDTIHQLGTTIIMATHNLDIVKALKKREIHLHQGKVIKDTGKKEKVVIHKEEKSEKLEKPEGKEESEKKEEKKTE